jgi:DNA replication protein DnaC
MIPNKYKTYHDQTVGLCDKCDPKGFVQKGRAYVPCSCYLEYIRIKKLLDSGIPRTYWDKNINDFKGDKKAKDLIQDYLKKLDTNLLKGLGLYLWGTEGIGKTLLATYILQEAVKKNKGAKFCYYTDMLNIFSASWKDEEAKQVIENDIMESDILLIDDLGKGLINKSNFGESSLDSVLRKRAGNLKSIIITSNLDRLDIKDKYGKGIVDLFKESLLEIHVIGESYRGKEKL